MSLHVDGRFVSERTLRVGASDVFFGLGDVTDTHNLLGASQYEVDPALEGEIDELRIYERALTDAEITATFEAGPDDEPGL